MARLLDESLAAGGLGFSSSQAPDAQRRRRRPGAVAVAAPRRAASRCAAVVREHPGTTLEFIPGASAASTTSTSSSWPTMSLAANRPLNWNVLAVNAADPDRPRAAARGVDRGAERGGRVLALTVPDVDAHPPLFKTGFVLDALPGWREAMALPARGEAGAARRSRPSARELRRVGATRPRPGMLGGLARLGRHDRHRRRSRPRTRPAPGRTVGDIAAERGHGPVRRAARHRASPTSCAPSCCPPAAGEPTTRRGSCASRCGATRARSSARPTPARTSTCSATFNYTTVDAREAVARARPAAAGGGRAPAHRRAGPALRPARARPARRGLARRPRGASTPTPSGPGPIEHALRPPRRRRPPLRRGRRHRRTCSSTAPRSCTRREFTGATPGTLLRSGRDTDTVTASPPHDACVGRGWRPPCTHRGSASALTKVAGSTRGAQPDLPPLPRALTRSGSGFPDLLAQLAHLEHRNNMQLAASPGS